MRPIRVVVEIRVPDHAVLSDTDLVIATQRTLFDNEATFRAALFGEPARRADYTGPKVKHFGALKGEGK